MKIISLYIVLACQWVAAPVCAATFFVSPSGNDDNTGRTEEQPFKIVQYAIDRMLAGDKLIVLAGIYSGTLKLKSGITLRAKATAVSLGRTCRRAKITFVRLRLPAVLITNEMNATIRWRSRKTAQNCSILWRSNHFFEKGISGGALKGVNQWLYATFISTRWLSHYF